MRYCLYLHVMGMTLTACAGSQPNFQVADPADHSVGLSDQTPDAGDAPVDSDDHETDGSDFDESSDEDAGSEIDGTESDEETTPEAFDTGVGGATGSESTDSEGDDTVLMEESHLPPDTGIGSDAGEAFDGELEFDGLDSGYATADDTGADTGEDAIVADEALFLDETDDGPPTHDEPADDAIDEEVPSEPGDEEPTAEALPSETEGDSEAATEDGSGSEDTAGPSDGEHSDETGSTVTTDDGDDAVSSTTPVDEEEEPVEADTPTGDTGEAPAVEPGIGDTCGVDGFIFDCGMVCTLDSWVGDGSCDDASRPFGDWFACAELDWDGGDCEPIEYVEPEPEPDPEPEPEPESPSEPEPTPCAEDGWIEDCTGKCSLDSWRGDGWCDDADSPFGADFDCAELSFDRGDCPPE